VNRPAGRAAGGGSACWALAGQKGMQAENKREKEKDFPFY